MLVSNVRCFLRNSHSVNEFESCVTAESQQPVWRHMSSLSVMANERSCVTSNTDTDPELDLLSLSN